MKTKAQLPKDPDRVRRYRVTLSMWGGGTKRTRVSRTERAYNAEEAGYQAKLFYSDGNRIVVVKRIEPFTKPKASR